MRGGFMFVHAIAANGGIEDRDGDGEERVVGKCI